MEATYTALLKGSLKLDKNGNWWHEGRQFENQKLSQLFHRSIIWDENCKEYFVQIGKQRATFDIEDCAFFVVAIDDSKIPWKLTLLNNSCQPLIPSTLELGANNQIYTRTLNGQRAKFLRSAHQVLLRHTLDGEHLKIAGETIRLVAGSVSKEI